MIRKTFRMSVHPGRYEEYARRHDPIWPELAKTLLDHGVVDYSIHLDPSTGDLFAYAVIESEDRWKAVATTEVCKRWWTYMSDVMPSNPDASPVARELQEVFHLEAG